MSLRELAKNVKQSSNKQIILTEGIKENKFNTHISKSYSFDKVYVDDFNVYLSSSNEMNNILIFKDLDIQKLISISSKSSLIITIHGSLTHFASLYNVPVFDIVPKDMIPYVKKYYPKSSKYKQVELNSSDVIINYVNNFIGKN